MENEKTCFFLVQSDRAQCRAITLHLTLYRLVSDGRYRAQIKFGFEPNHEPDRHKFLAIGLQCSTLNAPVLFYVYMVT